MSTKETPQPSNVYFYISLNLLRFSSYSSFAKKLGQANALDFKKLFSPYLNAGLPVGLELSDEILDL
jgi:hypothetical protein